MSKAQELAQGCVHCGLCTRNCKFLTKYEMDLGNFGEHPELAYHCFLCGDCTANCPKKIDGREIALAMRRDTVAANGDKVNEKGYGMLIAEKKNYIFRNHRKGKCKSVLFTGCNFPSFFPKTTEYLVNVLAEKGVGVVYDCCGKPVSELGLAKAENKALDALVKRLKTGGVEELVLLCPNCYYYLKPRIDIPCVNIYDKLKELGIGKNIPDETVHIFVPCPDKASHGLKNSLEAFLDGRTEVIKGAQCCGLGGCAGGKEPEISQGFRSAVKEQGIETVYAYCASCTGAMTRGGVENVHHVLVDVLGTNERPELSSKTIWNRAKRKFN